MTKNGQPKLIELFSARRPAGSRKLMRGFLFSYLLVLLLPTLTGGILYLMASDIMQHQVDRANQSRLRDTMEITDQQLSTMISYVDQIAINQSVTSLSNMNSLRPSSTDILDVMSSAEAFNYYDNTNPLIAEYYIHYNKSNITLSSRNIYLEFNRFYGTFFSWNGMSAAEWTSFAAYQRHDHKFYPAADTLAKDDQGSKTSRAILYMQSLPLEFHSRNDGYLAVLINESEIQRLLNGVELGETGQVFILNQNSDVMSSIKAKAAKPDLVDNLPVLPEAEEGHQVFKQGGIEYSLSFARSPDFGWYYIAAIPTSFVYSQLAILRLVLAIVFMAALLVGVFLAFRLSSRNARPWQEIQQAVAGNPEPAISLAGQDSPPLSKPFGFLTELDRIRQNVLQVVHKNEDLAKVIEVQLPVIQAGFINKLLTGRIGSADQLERERQLSGLPLQADGYLALLVKMVFLEDDRDEMMRVRVIQRLSLQELVRQNYQGQIYSVDDIGENSIAFLLLLDSEDLAVCLNQLRQQISGWQMQIREVCNLFCRMSVGQVYANPLDIHTSLDEARQALAFASLDQPAWFADLPKQPQAYYYPLEFENNLLNQVRAGNKAAIDQLFNRLIEENIAGKKLNPLLSELMSSAICGTLVHLLDQSSYDVSQLLQNVRMMSGKSLPEVIECARVICQSLADKVLQSRHKEDAALKDAVINYIGNNYQDPCFCLDCLRDQFPVSTSYINSILLERTGSSLAAYLESLRLEKACILLQDSSQSVQSVSTAVGYTSAHSFRRAFKRRYNMLPTEFQEFNQVEIKPKLVQ